MQTLETGSWFKIPFSAGAWFGSLLNEVVNESDGFFLGCFILPAQLSPCVVRLGVTDGVDCLIGLYNTE